MLAIKLSGLVNARWLINVLALTLVVPQPQNAQVCFSFQTAKVLSRVDSYKLVSLLGTKWNALYDYLELYSHYLGLYSHYLGLYMTILTAAKVQETTFPLHFDSLDCLTELTLRCCLTIAALKLLPYNCHLRLRINWKWCAGFGSR